MSAKIIDAFLFDGELDLLAHRLAETNDLVDLFVLVEAGETFQGAPKEMTFAANRERFSAYAAKIRHVALPRLGAAQDSAPQASMDAAWAREAFQRNAILFAIRDAQPEDILLLLDADEIPSRELLQRLRAEGLDIPRRLLMTRHYEAADLLGPSSPCCASRFLPFAFALGRKLPAAWDSLSIEWFSRAGVALPVSALLQDAQTTQPAPLLDRAVLMPFDVRRSTPVAGALPGAGRHLCFVDPAARPARKLGRVAHAELATTRGQSAVHLERCARYAVHHRGWWYAERPKGALPADLARLVKRVPEIRSGKNLPPILLRRLVRTWAWLRCWQALPEALVRAIDRHFKAAAVLLAPVLLVSDLVREGVFLLLQRFRSRSRRDYPSAHPGT